MNRLVAVGAMALALVGCSSAPAAQIQTVTASVTVTETSASTVTATVTASPAAPASSAVPSPDAGAALAKWGEPQPIAGSSTVTVHKVSIPISPTITSPAAEAGRVWAGVDAEICIGVDPGAEVSWSPWNLTAGSSRYEAESATYRSFPTPQYPVSAKVFKGECARGWIVFQVPGDGSIDTVRYSSSPSVGVSLVRWSAKG